ncbi:MAG TPA: glycosyltransferase family 2 protein [Alphaproteobacteria bacterium]
MDTKPAISFVATFYNKAAFAPAVLNAIINQRHLGDVEYILVDDGSTDQTLQILQDFAAKTPHTVLIHQKNQGPAVALNNGVKAARYPLIKPVEGDDILHPDLTYRLWQALEKYQAVATYVKPETLWYNLSNNPIYPQKPLPKNPPAHALHLNDHFKMGIGNGSMLLCRRDTFLAIGGADERVFVQDNTINMRLALSGPTFQIFIDGAVGFPALQRDRISSSDGQIIHDDLKALLFILQDHPTAIPKTLKQKSIRRKIKQAAYWLKSLNDTASKINSYKLCLFVILSHLISLSERHLIYTLNILKHRIPNLR